MGKQPLCLGASCMLCAQCAQCSADALQELADARACGHERVEMPGNLGASQRKHSVRNEKLLAPQPHIQSPARTRSMVGSTISSRSSQAALSICKLSVGLILVPHTLVGCQAMVRHTPRRSHACSARCRTHWLSRLLQARRRAAHPRAPHTTASRGRPDRRPGSPAWCTHSSVLSTPMQPADRHHRVHSCHMCNATGCQPLHAMSTATHMRHAPQCTHFMQVRAAGPPHGLCTLVQHGTATLSHVPGLPVNDMRRVVLPCDIQ